MTYSITEEEREGWRKLVLNRPDRLNAFNDEMHDRLSRALDEAATDTQCRAAVLTGAGRGFCAGQDLNDRVASDMEEIDLGQTVERFYNPLIRKLRSLPKPIICAVNGVAAGGSASHLWGPLYHLPRRTRESRRRWIAWEIGETGFTQEKQGPAWP